MVLVLPLKIDGPLRNVASVSANPSTKDGRDIPYLADVVDSDVSEVGQMLRDANIAIESTVYVGDDHGNSCGTLEASEHVEVYKVSRTSISFAFPLLNTSSLIA